MPKLFSASHDTAQIRLHTVLFINLFEQAMLIPTDELRQGISRSTIIRATATSIETIALASALLQIRSPLQSPSSLLQKHISNGKSLLPLSLNTDENKSVRNAAMALATNCTYGQKNTIIQKFEMTCIVVEPLCKSSKQWTHLF